jgi:hypothetical protein
MYRQILLMITIALLFVSGNAVAQFDTKFLIEKACKEEFPDTITDFISRRECVNEQMKPIIKREKEKKQKEESALREKNARECISGWPAPIERSSGYVSLILRLALVFEWPA